MDPDNRVVKTWMQIGVRVPVRTRSGKWGEKCTAVILSTTEIKMNGNK